MPSIPTCVAAFAALSKKAENLAAAAKESISYSVRPPAKAPLQWRVSQIRGAHNISEGIKLSAAQRGKNKQSKVESTKRDQMRVLEGPLQRRVVNSAQIQHVRVHTTTQIVHITKSSPKTRPSAEEERFSILFKPVSKR